MSDSPPLLPRSLVNEFDTPNRHVEEEHSFIQGISQMELDQLLYRLSGTQLEADTLWPDYGSPPQRLPRPASDDLHDRIANLSKTESKADANIRYAVQPRKWAKELQLSRGESPSWATLIRSRWLVIETIDSHLELWDIGRSEALNDPVATFDALSGSVDGCVLADTGGEPAQLYISTT
ncbi:hypothetical protein FS837_003516, partial [Tulasnella sp. UAMH 9824]